MKSKPFLLPAAVIVSLVLSAIGYWIVQQRAAILRDGTEIMLKAEPIDPRDMLRGQYVRLNYDISTIPVEELKLAEDAEVGEGSDIWVLLERSPDGYFTRKSVTLEQPEGDGLWLRGRTRHQIWDPKGGFVTVDYGIERYYAEEAQAKDMEYKMREGALTDVLVAVSADGAAQIKAFTQDGVTILTERLY